MAISDQLQMLLAAFIFGVLFYAATAAVLLYLRGHATTLFNDRRRLALVLFLTFSALWAQVDFVNFTIPATSSTACQVTIIASTLLDQAARVTIGGFLLWSVGHVKKTVVETYGLGTLMGIRIVMGGIFVAYARPQFAPVCVTRMEMPLISVVVMALDVIIIGVLVIRLFTMGLFDTIREVCSSTKQEQSKALVYCVSGFCLWTLTSITMLLGFESIILLLRTALPALGLMIIISIITLYTGALVLPREDEPSTPEARSPFATPPTQAFGRFSNNNGSPIGENRYTKGPNLFVVNPSHTPHDSQVTGYLEDIKAEDERYTGHRGRTIKIIQDENAGSNNVGNYRQDQASEVFQPSVVAPLGAGSSAAFTAMSRKASFAPANNVDQSRSSSTRKLPGIEAHQKRTLFTWSKKPADKPTKTIVISQPVMGSTENISMQPPTRVRTVDLATAAANERERREAAIKRPLVAMRPAPPPPKASEAWRKSSATRRKEVPKGISTPLAVNSPLKSSKNSSLSVDVNATSTSASLSPGREDMRRRSPRALQSLERDIEKAYTLASSSRVQSISTSLLNSGNQQTVMYVNDIVFDHPGTVKSIIRGAPKTLPKLKQREVQQMATSPKSFHSSALARSDSIMHRPRPYRRDSEKDRVLFPSEASPAQYHKRSKSASSISSKQSSLHSHSSRLTDIPALPQRPKTASELRKLLPNDTKSMSVDEKISLLFPAPPGVLPLTNRRSSVPSVPRIPSSVLAGDSLSMMLADQEINDRRASKRTTISFGGQVQSDGVTPVAETPILNELGIYRFSANNPGAVAKSLDVSRASTLADNVPGNLQPGVRHSQVSNSKRQSISTDLSFEADGSRDDSRSAWASIHSASSALEVATAKRTARETCIRMRKDADARNGGQSTQFYRPPSNPENEITAAGDGEGLMTIMFGMGDIMFQPPANEESFLLNPSPAAPEQGIYFPATCNPWHRRVGDELPAFSERRKLLRSRTMPPPTPLLLGSDVRRSRVVIHRPAVEAVEDTPESVLREIQAQLSRFEEPSRESPGALVDHMPHDSSKLFVTHEGDGIGLLENLEKEMGQQETRWMLMQHNFDRDSNSVILTPQKPLPSPPSEPYSRRTSSTISRQTRMKVNSTRNSNGGDSTITTSTQSSENSRATVWQQRLAEAQMVYMENASTLLNNPHLNFLSFQKGQPASPTPPDSLNSESDFNTDAEYETDQQSFDDEFSRDASSPKMKYEQPVLWERKYITPIVTVGHLWSPPQEDSKLCPASPEPAAIMVRPAQRQDHHSLPITSSTLWSKPITHATRPPFGLWGSRMMRPKCITTRPKTQRPGRKSKRVTFLPDILESPSPLPHKRDTLGIFQFPWGEKSDSAIYDPIPISSQATLQPDVFCPAVESNSSQLCQEPAEYLSSFFDDYEEDCETESEQYSEDEFDESTLWEIANLLNSVPSILPSPEIIQDYDDDEDDFTSNETLECSIQSSQASAFPSMSNFAPANPFKPLPALPPSEKDLAEELAQGTGTGLHRPCGAVWQTYLPALDEAVRGKPCEGVAQVSRSMVSPRVLWDKAIGAVSSLPVEKAVALWTRKATGTLGTSYIVPDQSYVKSTSQNLLWSMQETQMGIETGGLFDARTHRSGYRTSHEVPAAIATRLRHRISTAPLKKLESHELWCPRKSSSFERHWISESSVRACSPSVCSMPSSGRSSPCSDNASIVSSSTKASSLCSLDETITNNLTKDRTQQVSDAFVDVMLPTADAEDGVIDSVQQAPRHSLSSRGSRVLASRDLWESNAPASGSISQTKTWRSSKVALPEAFQGKISMTATATEWDAALAEAVYLGTPWAQILSAPTDNRKSVKLEVTSQGTYPAQCDKTILGLGYDPAARHPVFFTSNMVSSAAIVHPAATGHVSQPSLGFTEPKSSESLTTQHRLPPVLVSPMEMKLSLSTRFAKSSLDSSSTQGQTTAAFMREAARVSLCPNKPSNSDPQASMIPVPSVWTPPTHSNTNFNTAQMTLWIPSADRDPRSRVQERSPVVTENRPATSRPPFKEMATEIVKFENAELWHPKWMLKESPKEWLTSAKRRASKVQFRY